jgi:hypothetical protein
MATSQKRKPKANTNQLEPPKTTPLIFISHDSSDAEIAEAFSRLLSSVSMGVLKSFRSSDQKGTQGIEYGTEWYGEIMKKLDSASDVVCLLTARSLQRPWILYEAGVAKGKLEKTVLGIALGIPLKKAATGPFAQFQNCDDSDEKLTSLIIQLCNRVPDAEPDRDVIKQQVIGFKKKTDEILKKLGNEDLGEDAEETSVAELFEEVKVMFQDLPSRISRQVGPRKRRFRRLQPMLFEELSFLQKRHSGNNPVGLLVAFSLFKEDAPWLFELGYEIYRAVKTRKMTEAKSLLEQFQIAMDITRHSGFFEDVSGEKDLIMLAHEIPELVARAISNAKLTAASKRIGGEK